jgi:hypothetical protein
MIDISNQVEVCGTASIYRGYSLCGGIGIELEIKGDASIINEYVLYGEPKYYIQSIIEANAISYLEYELKGRGNFTIFVSLRGNILIGDNLTTTIKLRDFNNMPLKDCTKDYITQFMSKVNPSDILYSIDYLMSRARVYLPEFNSIPFNEALEHELDKQRNIVTIPIDYIPTKPGHPKIWGISLILYKGYPVSIIINEGYKKQVATRYIISEVYYKQMIDFIWSLFCVEANIDYDIFKPNDPPSIQVNKDYSQLNTIICGLNKDNNTPLCL